MDFKNIILMKEEGIATITLNRPDKLNAINTEMAQELFLSVDEVARDKETKVVVLTGAGRGFCSGADLETLTAGEFGSIIDKKDWVQSAGAHFVKRLANLEKPVITAVNGPAIGAGFGLALAGDYIIASDKASFSMIFVRMGLIPDSASLFLLPRLLGVSKAKEICFSGDSIDAMEAERIGLVNKVVATDQLKSATTELASRLAQGPSKAIAFMKTIINIGLNTNNIDTVIAHEAQAQVLLFETEDFKEGTKAFFEKRLPEFKGK